MIARFNDGPYDQTTLHMKESVDHLRLPVKLSTNTPAVDPPKSFDCQAKYRLVLENDYEARYQFEGITAP